MKRIFLNKILLMALMLSAFACKTRKVATVSAAPSAQTLPKASSGKSDAIKSINSAQVQFSTVAIKAKADLSLNGDKHDVNMNIRIRKNEAIWISVTAFVGIEAARVLITPDSIKILNRLQNEYTAKPFSYVQRFANRQIDFTAVQALLTGAAIPATINEKASFKTTNGQLEVSGALGSLMYTLLFNADNNLLQNNLDDRSSDQQLSVTYSAFQNVNGQNFPFGINISSSAQGKAIMLNLKCNSVELNNNFDLPFSVPKKFTIKN